MVVAMISDTFTGGRRLGGPIKGVSTRTRTYVLAGLGAVALLAAACSSSSSGTSGSTTPPAGSAGGTAVVKVMTVPNFGRILTDSAGKPLYTLSGTCTGACASAWPALTVPTGTTPTGGSGVTGTLKAVKQPNGTFDVTYNGSPLYTFVSDTSGHVTGQGVQGFSVVMLSKSTGSASSSTSTTRGSGY